MSLLGGYQKVYENSIVEKPKNISVKYILSIMLASWKNEKNRPTDRKS